MVPGYSPNCKTSVPVYRVGLEVHVEGTLTGTTCTTRVYTVHTPGYMNVCVCHVALDMCTHVGCSTL